MGKRDIGLREVVALTQERFSQVTRQSVGEAVAIVQRRGMTAFAESAETLPREEALLHIDRYQLNSCSADETIEVAKTVGTATRLEYGATFQPVRDGHQALVGILNCVSKGRSLRLIL